MRFGRKIFQKSSCKSRFADAGFAGNQYHLTVASLRLRPAPQQQLGFFLAPDEGSQAARMQCLEAAFDGARSQRHPGEQRLGDTVRLSGAGVPYLKEIAKKPSRGYGKAHCVWLRNPLKTSRKVWCLTDDAAFLRFA